MEEIAIVLRVEGDDDDVTLQDLGGHLEEHVVHKDPLLAISWNHISGLDLGKLIGEIRPALNALFASNTTVFLKVYLI